MFDPGINAFSIASLIFPAALFVRSAALHFPDASHTPITAEIAFESPASDGPLTFSLDWRRAAGEEWTIRIVTADRQTVELLEGGARLKIDGVAHGSDRAGKYPDIYRQFAEMVAQGESHVDSVPLRMVADCQLVGSRNQLD